jgi:hypothetical protein
MVAASQTPSSARLPVGGQAQRQTKHQAVSGRDAATVRPRLSRSARPPIGPKRRRAATSNSTTFT